jgi:hypothetical protein
VLSPIDNTIVSTQEIPVSGLASPNAVVSINGTLIDIDVDGTFTTTLLLDEGPNLIEVLATNLAGEEEYQPLLVIYIP